jgi:GH15 family glucan-1,4-alpha-glucosidase
MNNLDYGIIGNGKSAALISQTGSIDWCCLPDFDSSSFFAHLLDRDNGGFFRIEPLGSYRTQQMYLNHTNILQTRFINSGDSFEILDFMPRYIQEDQSYHCPPELIRYVRVLSGRPAIRIHYNPKPNYARDPVAYEITPHFLKHFTTQGTYESIYFYSNLPYESVVGRQPIILEKDCFFLVSYNQKLRPLTLEWVELEFERTKVYWMGWTSKTTVVTRYSSHVERSALVLKLLAYQKTGAILAAVTTSLPEVIGEVRNWDYRFCWIRDASMTIRILARLGHYNVARRFLRFILDIVPYKDEQIQILYSINRRRTIAESELTWLSGYEDSKPVRIGNAAVRQKQNDIYGVLMDVIYQSLVLFPNSLDDKEDLWTVVRTLARHVQKNWNKLDSGIWEFRTERRHFTFSKILCWVAMDRAARIADMFHRPAEAENFLRLRDRIKSDILKKGRHPQTGALTQSYGSTTLDAANLLSCPYGFLAPNDPIYIQTVRETYKQLCVNGLMYRYRDADDFGIPKSSFIACTFWMIKSLHQIGEKDKALELFESMLSHANHLGLYSEDMDFQTYRLLGNFPQGYSHIALIDTILTLSEVPETP